MVGEVMLEAKMLNIWVAPEGQLEALPVPAHVLGIEQRHWVKFQPPYATSVIGVAVSRASLLLYRHEMSGESYSFASQGMAQQIETGDTKLQM